MSTQTLSVEYNQAFTTDLAIHVFDWIFLKSSRFVLKKVNQFQQMNLRQMSWSFEAVRRSEVMFTLWACSYKQDHHSLICLYLLSVGV